jgi:hypothetical protein
MSSFYSNPNNHVPEVTPSDDWGDDGNHPQKGALPPRRHSGEIALIIPEQAGIRIGVRDFPPERPEADVETKFTVQEIGAVAIRLEKTLPRPSRIIAVENSSPAILPAIQTRHPRGEGRDWGVSRTSGLRWLVGGGCGVACVVIAAMSLMPVMRKRQDAGEKSIYSSIIVEEAEPVEGIEFTEELVRAEGRARAIFKHYATATDVDQFVKIVRSGEGIRETLLDNWRPLGLDRNWEPADDAAWSVVSSESIRTGLLEGYLPDYSRYAAYFIIENGRLHMDWEATAAYSSASYADLEAGNGDASVIRGLIGKGAFHTTEFPETEYRSLSLTSPEGLHTIWIYARKGTAVDDVLAELFDVGDILEKPLNQKHLVTLSLRRPDGNARANQWLVGEMLHIGWLVP